MASQFISLPLSSGGGPVGANLSLSNLTLTAINQSLVPGVSGLDLGSSAFPWDEVFAAMLVDSSGNNALDVNARVLKATNEVDVLDAANAAKVIVLGDGSTDAQLQLNNAANTFSVILRPSAILGADLTFTLPTTDGSAGQVLETDGSGNLSWTSLPAAGANTTLSNLTSPVAINQNLNPVSNTIEIGNSIPFQSISSQLFYGKGAGGSTRFFIDPNNPMFTPSGDEAYVTIAASGLSAPGVMALYSPNQSGIFGTMPVNIESGNATGGGNSGNVSLIVGTASDGGTQGDIRLHKAGTSVTVGHVWTATHSDGRGYWAAASGGSPAGSTGSIQFNNAGAFAADASNLHWDDSNNRLGLGTTSPIAPLELSFGNAYQYLSSTSAGSATYIGMRNTANSSNSLFGTENSSGSGLFGNGLPNSLSIGTVGAAPIAFHTNNNTTPRMVIASAGNVGIGTSSPSYKLHVLDTAGFLGYFKTSAGGCLVGLENDTGIQVVLNSQSGTSKVGTNTNHDFHLCTNNINRVQITAGGNFVFNGNTANVDASAATGPLRLPNLASDPGSPANGDMWYNTTSNQLKACVNGVTVVIA